MACEMLHEVGASRAADGKRLRGPVSTFFKLNQRYSTQKTSLRACLKIRKGAVFGPQAGWRGATKENILYGSSTEEQRSQPACGPKTLRAAGLLTVGFVGSDLTAHCGDAQTSPPRPQPKSLAAAPFPIFSQALSDTEHCADRCQGALLHAWIANAN